MKGIIFPNRTAFNGKETAVKNYYLANVKNASCANWSLGIDSTDDDKVLMIVDSRVFLFPWSPEQIVDINPKDPKWFPNPEI